MKPLHLQHASGSPILEVHRCFHECYPPKGGFSRDVWGLRCTVKWSDTGATSKVDVLMCNVAHDNTPEGLVEFNTVSKTMMDYLSKNGEWKWDNTKNEGWSAYRREGIR
jgi:hypothetical protein